jgi:hypothetical protein
MAGHGRRGGGHRGGGVADRVLAGAQAGLAARNRSGVSDDDPVAVESSPDSGLPDTVPVDPARSPDAAMLADPHGMAMARHADFDAWYAAGAALPRPDTEMPPPRTGVDVVPDAPDTMAGENDDASL